MKTELPSDVETVWQRNINNSNQWFNGDDEVWTSDSSVKLPGAIYFNKEGFDKDNIHYSNEEVNSQGITWNGDNFIEILRNNR